MKVHHLNTALDVARASRVGVVQVGDTMTADEVAAYEALGFESIRLVDPSNMGGLDASLVVVKDWNLVRTLETRKFEVVVADGVPREHVEETTADAMERGYAVLGAFPTNNGVDIAYERRQ